MKSDTPTHLKDDAALKTIRAMIDMPESGEGENADA